MTDLGPRHRLSSKCLLAVVVLVAVALVGLCVYAAFGMTALRRGSAGPLMQDSPGSAPAPVTLPRKTP